MGKMYNATVTKNKKVHENLFILNVKTDQPRPVFLPGQYTAVGVELNGKIQKRAYSICSGPAEEELEFFIATVQGGVCTPVLSTLEPGSRVFVQPKITGTFTLSDVPEGKELVFVATGTGLAPFVSMLKDPSLFDRYSSVTLAVGVRLEADLAYHRWCSEISASNDKVSYFSFVSRETPVEDSVRAGRVNLVFSDGLIEADPARQHFFLCGNPAMIEEMEAYLVGRGFSIHSRKTPGNVHSEKYW